MGLKYKKIFMVFICSMCILSSILLGMLLSGTSKEFIDHPGISILSRPDTKTFPENGFVPDKETALKIAKAVWLPIYGKKYLMFRIYQVKLENDIWYIEGSSKIHLFFRINGGGPYIKIDKASGAILDVSHTG